MVRTLVGQKYMKKTFGKIKNDAQIPFWNSSSTNHDTTKQTWVGRSDVPAFHHTPDTADLTT